MKKDLTKYRVSAPLKKGKYVAATSPQEALEGCFPDHDVKFYREGFKWWQYKVDPPIPWGWPRDLDSQNVDNENFGDVVDVEKVGTILVVIGEDDESEQNRTSEEDCKGTEA